MNFVAEHHPHCNALCSGDSHYLDSDDFDQVVWLVRRLLSTPPDQDGLLGDRLNDLAVWLEEFDAGVGR